MNKINLSKRLEYIASFVTNEMILGDIGSDHGYLPLFLLQNNIIKKAYASDNKKGPYNNLKSSIDENYDIEIALKDGLDDLPNYVNTISLTGMGGELIISIIEKHLEYLEHIEYILVSPQRSIPLLRRFLNNLNYKVVKEGIVKDDHYYEVILYQKGKEELSFDELNFGKLNLQNKENIFIEYLDYQRNEIINLLNKNISQARRDELTSKLNYLDQIKLK